MGKLWNPILRVVAVYFFVAVIWILFSDNVISWFTQDSASLTRLQSYKGAAFVLVTSVLLFFLLRREVKKLETEIEENLLISEDFQTSNEQLVAIINSSPLAIITLDDQLNIRTWNPAAERMFGWKAEEIFGRQLPHIPEDFKDAALEIQKRIMNGETILEYETRRITKDGRVLNVLFSGAPLHNKNGEIVQLLGILGDITDRKQVEEKLLRLSSELERRVQERTAALEKANNALTVQIHERQRMENELRDQAQRLEAINKELESFSYSVSHDLRAPLRQISGYSNLLLEESQEELSPQTRSDIDRIRRGAALMSELIDALLVLSRVSRGNLNEMEMDLADFTREVFNDLRNHESNRQVSLVVPEHVPIIGDPRLLRVIIENLISNAWKFTSKTQDACIEFGVLNKADSKPVYYVRDNGVGFPSEKAGKIFNAFQRLHNSEEYPGMGIGLTTVQRIIHRYGGSIWAEGEIDQGATIYFTLGKAREA